MPDQRNMLDQTKMTAPIPAVGAAGEQSENKKSNDIIPKDRKNNNSLHTLSMTELYDTTYKPTSGKAARRSLDAPVSSSFFAKNTSRSDEIILRTSSFRAIVQLVYIWNGESQWLFPTISSGSC